MRDIAIQSCPCPKLSEPAHLTGEVLRDELDEIGVTLTELALQSEYELKIAAENLGRKIARLPVRMTER